MAVLTNIYSRFIDQRRDFREVAHQSKLLIFRTAMSSELHLLAQMALEAEERAEEDEGSIVCSDRTAPQMPARKEKGTLRHW
ncbi:MAG: hypothetical protein HUU20_20380 [Pirellulales bacterium]|nr:hypothetical protein [Pirellulales bacterium]